MVSLSNSYSRVSYEVEAERKLLKTDERFGEIPNVSNGISRNTVASHGWSKEMGKEDRKEGHTQASRARLAVILAACFYLMLCSAGVYVSLGIIYVELIAYFDSPRSEAALVQSLFAGFSQGGGIFTTSLVLKCEPGLVVMLSSFVTAVSFCASAFAPNIQVVITLIGVVAGLANSVNVLMGYTVVSWTFREKRKAALAVLLIGPAVGQIVLPYIVTALIDGVLWSDTVIILGALMFLNCIPCGLVIYYSRHYFQKGDVTKLKNSKLADMKCLTDVAFIVFVISFVGFSAFNTVEHMFVVDMSVLKGFSTESSTTLLSINGLMIALGRIVAMLWLRVAPDTKLERHLIYIYLGLAISHIIISESAVYWGMVLGMILRGSAASLVGAMLPGLQIDMRGIELFPQTMALSNCVGGVGAILGGYVGGLSYDITKSYSFVYFLAAGTNVFSAIAMVIIIIVYNYRRSQEGEYEKLLHGNTLGDVGIKVLHPTLKSHPGIMALDVGDCEIGDDGLELLCGLLPGSNSRPGLRELVLSSNPAITNKGWAKLSLALMQGTNLRMLYVDYNDLTDVSASCLLMGVAASRALETLDMECTGVTEATGQLLLNLLEQYPTMTLKSVNLTENNISKATMEAITMRLPDSEDQGSRLLDFNSDEEHSLATSEPPLDNEYLVDDVSDIGEDIYKVHPVTVAVADTVDGGSSETTEAKADSGESSTAQTAKTKSNESNTARKAKTKDKSSTKSVQSLADKIKSKRPSSAVTAIQPKGIDDINVTVRSSSIGDVLTGQKSAWMKSDNGTEDQPNTTLEASDDTGSAQDTESSYEEHVETRKKEHTFGQFLIPETPSVVSLHKYHEGLRGQDNDNFQPIESPSTARPKSAPVKNGKRQNSHSKQHSGSPKELPSSTKSKQGQKQATATNKQELQVIDTRRRLSCGSVLPSNYDKNRCLSAGTTGNLRSFTRSHSLQTPEQKSQPLSTDSSEPGSPEQDIRRRLSSANIQPLGFSDNVQSTSVGSSSTLGDLHLEEIA